MRNQAAVNNSIDMGSNGSLLTPSGEKSNITRIGNEADAGMSVLRDGKRNSSTKKKSEPGMLHRANELNLSETKVIN